MIHEAKFSCMEIWNSKSSGNMHFEFKEKFGVLFEVYFKHTIYGFKAQEVRSPTLQMYINQR